MKTSFVFIPRHFFFVSCHHESFSISNVSLIGAFVFCKCRRLIDFDAFDKQYLLWTIRRGKESRLNLRHHHGAVVVDIVNGSAACQAQLRKWTVNSKVYRRKLPLEKCGWMYLREANPLTNVSLVQWNYTVRSWPIIALFLYSLAQLISKVACIGRKFNRQEFECPSLLLAKRKDDK